ncbi:MAG: LptF/LptG family permease [Planctomycetes bacterium]|nr:LptF/LptG family permease [Planctomycetota bacterium]
MMRILQRYILTDFVANLLGALGIFTGFMFLANLLKPIREGFSLLQVAQLVHLYIPYVLTWSIPMSVLTASVVTSARLAETGELTAIQSGGIHVLRLMTPVLAVVSLLCLLSFYANSSLIPLCRVMCDSKLDRMAYDLAMRQFSRPGEKKEIDLPPYKIYVGGSEGQRLASLNIRTSLGSGETLVLRAREAVFISTSSSSGPEAKLVMSNGSTALVPGVHHGVSGTDSGLDTVVPPREWTWTKNVLTVLRTSEGRVFSTAKDKTMGELFRATQGRLFAKGGTTEERTHLIELHKRASLSVASLVFALLGAPLGIWRRRSNRLLGFALSLLFAVGIYFPLLLLGNALAKREFVSPWLGLWFPNLLFVLLGLWFCRAAIRG